MEAFGNHSFGNNLLSSRIMRKWATLRQVSTVLCTGNYWKLSCLIVVVTVVLLAGFVSFPG